MVDFRKGERKFDPAPEAGDQSRVDHGLQVPQRPRKTIGLTPLKAKRTKPRSPASDS